jgi:LmbE family N-acetylglucosaminyl deacetylase
VSAGAVVAVVAHPDDESLIAGGTLALAARAGLPTGAVALTRGELGPISDPTLATPETLGAVREGELRAAGALLGLGWTACLGHPDGELETAEPEAVAADLAGVLGPRRPAVLLTFGADGLYWHPDHVATGLLFARVAERLSPRPAVYEAVWDSDLVSRLVAAVRERGLPADLWGLAPEAFGSDEPATVTVDVRAVLARKLAALRAHRTQLAADHLLSALPDDLAGRFLGEEAWRLAGPRAAGDPLAAMLGGGGDA